MRWPGWRRSIPKRGVAKSKASIGCARPRADSVASCRRSANWWRKTGASIFNKSSSGWPACWAMSATWTSSPTACNRPSSRRGRIGATVESNETLLDGPLQPLFFHLRERHARNSQALREALQGERYSDLVAALKASIAEPAIKEEAWESCRTALPPLVAAAWRRLKSGSRELDQGAADADFHEVRKSAKRARYTAELIAPALGRRAERRAKRFIRLTTKVQDVLGEHQDAIVATAEIERFLADHPHDDAAARAARDLLETQHQAAQAARSKFFDVWKKLDRKKSVRWFKNESKASV